jgi:glycosyltransferase involved in cell wall biosynthesis
MISVCMAVKNGAKYIDEQIDSILSQLGAGDELIVSDDHSSDETLGMVQRFEDPRIRIFSSPKNGAVHNFEFALSRSSGEFIFLADQDDIWHENKLATMMPFLQEYDMVVCDCMLVDDDRNVLSNSFFDLKRSGKGFLKNLVSNSYMGCCMGFSRRILSKALPFPDDVAAHDFWIGMVAESHFKSLFLKEVLVSHRIHDANASTSGRESITPHMKRVTQRYQLVRNLISRSL